MIFGKTKGGSVGPLRTPDGKAVAGMKVKLNPKIASNTMRGDIGTGAAKVRSAQTAGKIIKPW